jgi:molybdate/tungstate transport system substrate-binding protein
MDWIFTDAMKWKLLILIALIPLLGYFVFTDGEVNKMTQESRAKETTSPISQNELVIFHAGSLSVPLERISAAFLKKHPGLSVKPEASGSRHCARKISELGFSCDIMASSDYRVVEELLMPRHATFNILFARNEMVIACNGKSRKARLINRDNWREILLSGDVSFGRSEPDFDPCGYRTLMVFKLAEAYYGDAGLAERLQAKDGNRYVRPKETDLLSLLEMNEIDYLFIYKSVAAQHGLQMVELPPQVSLGSPAMEGHYAGVTVAVSGKNPGEKTLLRGEPMIYSITIPTNAKNREMAEEYLEFLLSPQGRAILEECGQEAISPPICREPGGLPAKLKPLCRKE